LLHNRYLPVWLHRFLNGSIAGFLSFLVLLFIVHVLQTSFALLLGVVLAFIGGFWMNPSRYSFVEGCAGDLGYDELLDEDNDVPGDEAMGNETHA
jgi:hypothetical protein